MAAVVLGLDLIKMACKYATMEEMQNILQATSHVM
jgi:hypothetical protein